MKPVKKQSTCSEVCGYGSEKTRGDDRALCENLLRVGVKKGRSEMGYVRILGKGGGRNQRFSDLVRKVLVGRIENFEVR